MRIKDGFTGERSIVLPKLIIEMMEDDPLASILHITDIGYYPKALHHFRERNKPIDQFVFIYCIDGRGWYEIHGKRHDVTANQYFILPAGTPHTYASDEHNPWTIYWIHFKGPLAKYYAADALEPQTISPGITSKINQRIHLFETIYNTLDTSFSLESIRYAMSAFHHYLASLRYVKAYRDAGNSRVNPDVIDLTIHFLNENIEKHLTLKEISDFSGFSPSHLSAMFKERTGHSVLNYFNLLKIRRACELLDNTKMKLNQISYKVGIADQFYFSRLFTKIMGVSPTVYRTQQKA